MKYEVHIPTGACVLLPNGAHEAKPGFEVREATPEEEATIAATTGALHFDGSKLVRVYRMTKPTPATP